MNARYYNVPQDRKRVILVGLRKDLNVPYFKYPEPSEKIVTIADALKGVPEPSPKDAYPLYYVDNGYWQHNCKNHRRDWNETSKTIIASVIAIPLHPSSPPMIKNGRYWRLGDGESRRFSYQECAALQTFPRDMKFVGNLRSKYQQIGNAVPCNLAQAVARSLRAQL